MTSERMFPVHSQCDARKAGLMPDSVPWSFVASHEHQAMVNHSQDLETLARRGGLSAKEMLAVVTDTSFWKLDRALGDVGASRYLLEMLKTHNDPPPAPSEAGEGGENGDP